MKPIIRDISLASVGAKKIRWAESFMSVLNSIKKDLIQKQAFANKTVVMSIHLEAKTAFLALVLKEAGANVILTGSNPLSTQDDVAAALAQNGVTVYAKHGCSEKEYFSFLNVALDHLPDLILDDGGDLTSLLISDRADARVNLLGGSEETTTGVNRLRNWEKDNLLSFPMVAVNDSMCKYLFDNRYGTGQSVWDGIIRTANLTVSGKNVVVAGYGWCGKGVAMRAKGLGAKVYITEIDPIKAIEAVFDGFSVLKMEEAASIGDIFITVTGCNDVINKLHFSHMKSGAILCNAGHFDVEINTQQLKEVATKVEEVRKNITGFTMPNGKILYLLADGRLVNLAAADGHPVEIMDLSFALQLLALNYIQENSNLLENRVYLLPPKVDHEVARIKLNSLGVKLDRLTTEQYAYLYRKGDTE